MFHSCCRYVPQPEFNIQGMTETSAPKKQKHTAIRKNGRYNMRRRSRPAARGPAQPLHAVYAALDLGTNNCRLLVAKPSQNGFRIIDAFSRIVRLGEGLGNSDSLSEEAIERTLHALQVCKNKLEMNQVTRARLVATEACRGAKNGADFTARVKDMLGLDIEIVDRKTEAFLAVAGCSSLVDPRAEASIIFDIGGGSTEIACLRGKMRGRLADPSGNIRAWDSLETGVVTLAERYGGHDVNWETYEAMVAEVEDLLAGFASRAKDAVKAPYFHLLGTSGTVTTLGGLFLGLARYDRRRVDGLWMSDRDMTEVIEHLIGMSYEERAANGCVGKERADLVLAGCAILDAIRRIFPARFLRIADRGLREGILMKMMREDGVWRQGAA